MKGKRVQANKKGIVILDSGDYGKDERGIWCVRPPNRYAGSIPNHKVVEHEDGTITVSPSILLDDGGKEKWHGYLERGVWREV